MKNKSGRSVFCHVFFFLLFLLVWALLFWKCRYGFANIDESFYLTVPFRLCLGDKLILHEWHPTQTSGFLLFPLVKVYLALFGSTEGILLHFRWIFTTVWGLGALFVFQKLRRFSFPGAALASISFLIYTPFGIMALSYNSLGILLMVLTCVLLACAEPSSRFQLIIAGMLFAGAVLCCPYLLIPYLFFTLIAPVYFLLRKDSYLLRLWCFLSLGSLLILILFCLSFLPFSSFDRYREALRMILSDPQHPSIGFFGKVETMIWSIRTTSPFILVAVAVTLLSAFLCRQLKCPELGFLAVCAAAVVLFLKLWYINHYMFPVSLLGFYCYINANKDSAIKKLFWAIWVPGFLYACCVHLGSNQTFLAFSSASTVSTIASYVIAFLFLKSAVYKATKTWVSSFLLFALLVVSAFQLQSVLYNRITQIYWDSTGMAAQTALAESGPEKGILMNADIHEFYTLTEEDINTLCEDPEVSKVLFVSTNTWLYLSAQKEYSTYSAWLSGTTDQLSARFDQYFSLFPEKLPDAVFLDRDYAMMIPHFEELGYLRSDLRTSEYAVIMKRAPLSEVPEVSDTLSS